MSILGTPMWPKGRRNIESLDIKDNNNEDELEDIYN